MKVSFSAEISTHRKHFVLNQITAFIDMGHEVEIDVALQKAIPNILTPHGRSMAAAKPAGYG